MSQVIPESYLDLLEKPAFGNLGTLMKDGSPQVTPVWVDYDGKHVRINSAKGRVKDKNMRRDPHVSIAIQDPANPYRSKHENQTVCERHTAAGDCQLVGPLETLRQFGREFLGIRSNSLYPSFDFHYVCHRAQVHTVFPIDRKLQVTYHLPR